MSVKNMYREHECVNGHKWTEPVRLNASTQRLSGESYWCPTCEKRAQFSSEAKEQQPRFTDEKLYIEFRFHFRPNANQETLRMMAEKFQEVVYDEWNNTLQPEMFDVTDITFEIVREVVK